MKTAGNKWPLQVKNALQKNISEACRNPVFTISLALLSDFLLSITLCYLVLVCALLKLFQLVVEHSELPGDALYSSMQTPVLAVLCVEIVFIPLALLWGGDHCVLSGIKNTKKINI